MITITQKIDFSLDRAGRRRIATGDRPPKPVVPPRTPRVSKLMALAIRFDKLLRNGTISDTMELADLCQVTQPRITQILNLNHLSPDIQEEILFLPQVNKGRDPIHEKLLRPVTRKIAWSEQRELWREIKEDRRADNSDSEESPMI